MAVAGAAVLVGVVLLVRPGTQAPDGLALPTQAPSGPSPAADPLPTVPIPDVEDLAQWRVDEVAVDGGGIGPFRLGAQAAGLVESGWQQVEQPDGCVRLRGASVQGADLLGWAVDGEVVSLQVRLHADEPPPPGPSVVPLGLTADRTLEAIGGSDGLTDLTIPAGDRTVRLLELSRGSTTISVSDLGGELVRHLEVATRRGRDCTPTPETLLAEFPPTVLPETRRVVEDPTTYADLLPEVDALGLPVDEAIDQGVPVVASTDGCQTSSGTDGRDRDVSTTVRDGVVVGQRVTRPGWDATALDLTFVEDDGALVRQAPGTSSVVDTDGGTVRFELLTRERLVVAVDGGVLTGPPVVQSRRAGEDCGGP
ncbi:hypothetical protein [Aquipuribacter sp. MA13-6]|uniref:hypothetical protein n=1 Tax=unclassified Aquipuribacter TaxID=2635084 RepID=UPI003EF00989